MTNRQIKSFVNIEDDGKKLLNNAAESLKLSARVYMRCLKAARTIADLENSANVSKAHIAEALQYRPTAKNA